MRNLNYKRKFAREAGHLNKLNHPHIIKVEELFEANNTIYYTMEYCEGGSLDDLILRKGTITEIECLKFVRQISCALTFMHNHKMLHLDLKPANVMLRANGDAVLIDFGLSKQYDENGIPESSTTIGGGTPGYAPIEQANYQKNSDFPVTMDVYALGATMYKMLTGVRPAEASVLLNEGFPVYELQERNISEHLLSCIIKAMASLKKNRFQSVVEFMNALDDENSVIDNAFAKEEKTEEREDEIINTIEQLQSNGLYKDAYNLCLDCIRRNRQIDYANKKCAELIPLLKLQNKINSRRTVILVTIITTVSTLISIIVYVSSL